MIYCKNISPFLLVLYNLSLVVYYVINKEGSDATNKPKQSVPLAHHCHEASSSTQCNHNLSLLDADQLAHQISSKTCVNHSTISMLHSKYFPRPYKCRNCGGCTQCPGIVCTPGHCVHLPQFLHLYGCGKYLECNIDIVEWFTQVLEEI